MKPKIMKLLDIPSKAVGGHDGFSARSLINLPDKEMTVRLIKGSAKSIGPVPPHNHPATHFFIVLEGRLELEIDGTTHIVPKGFCAEIPPNSVHQLRCAGKGSMTFLAIKWE